MDIPGLGVGDIEGFVSRVAIGFAYKLPMEREDIVSQPGLKLLYIFPIALAPRELVPSFEEIFG